MVDELFSKRLPLTLKSQDREDRRSQIHVTVEIHSNVGPSHRKELVIRLTDEKDLFFLYTLRLTEEDFQSLKVQQGLLVDFGAFPQKFIDLLELCLQEERKEVPKFIMDVVSNGNSPSCTANLNIIETNPFKHLVHLSLKFLPGTDTDVKKYLANCLKTLKDQNATLLSRLEHTESDLSQQLRQVREALSTRTVELDNLKSEWGHKSTELSSRYTQEINTEKERALQAQQDQQQRYDREKREMEQLHAKNMKQMDSRIYELETANKDLTDRKYKSESTIREQKTKIATLEDENHRSKTELQTLRKNNSSLDSDFHEQEKTVNQLKTRLAVLEQEVKDKEEVMQKTSDLLGTEKDYKKKYEDDLDRKKRQVTKMESSIKTMADELRKANDIIKRLQGEIRNTHSKLKMRNQVTTEQEKLLVEKNKEMEEIRKELQEQKSELREKQEESKVLNDKLETSLKKLEESKELLKTNENVINWLNRQVNEVQLHSSPGHRPGHGPFEMPSGHNPSSAGFRPSPAVMHNYTASSYSSRASGTISGGPISHNSSGQSVGSNKTAPRQAQVQYQPPSSVQQRVSVLPQPVAKSSPIGTIPEERANGDLRASPHHLSHSQSAGALDNKYLSHSQEAPLRAGSSVPRHTTPSPIGFLHPSSHPATSNTNPTRLSKDVIVSRGGAKPPTQPPLASAYFPGNAKVS